jgi:feruloyl esterase
VRRRVFSAAAGAILVAVAVAAPRVFAEGACERLVDLNLPQATITAATEVRAGVAPFFTTRGFCRVKTTIVPTRDSDIKAEVWLPIRGWNGKFQAVGNADAAGVISYDAMVEAIRRGYATSSTDTGHVGNTLAFALGHREKYVDFGYRAVHEMTVRAKSIIERFYGTPASHAYWNGCSQGGRQGITEAIRYPADYDAIIAGAPAIEHMRLHAMRLALNMFVHRSGESYIPPAKYQLIHRAALQACDALDGLADGLIANPTRCHFDPAVLECHGADGPSCLTEVEVETARAMYTPIVLPSTGRIVLPALLQPGSELGWARLGGAEPLVNAVEPFKYVVFNNANWDWHAFRLVSDLPRAIRADEGVIDRTDPNLEPFFNAGGKLLMYHGWSDPQVPALDTIDYFNAVLKTTTEARRGTSIELYMEPGVSHCFGGDGPDTFDAIGALDHWVRDGRAPSRIVAARFSSGGDLVRTRPLCRYPEIAKYVGSGSIDEAASFRCTTDGAASAVAHRLSRPPSKSRPVG